MTKRKIVKVVKGKDKDIDLPSFEEAQMLFEKEKMMRSGIPDSELQRTELPVRPKVMKGRSPFPPNLGPNPSGKSFWGQLLQSTSKPYNQIY